MKILRKIIVFPVLLLVAILSTCVKLILKAEEYVIGVAILLVGICVVLALINQMWLQLGILIMISVLILFILFFSVQVDIWMEDLLDFLRR